MAYSAATMEFLGKNDLASYLNLLGLIGGVVMPLWNIPLIARIVRRRSCGDISLFWLFGVWGCILLMLPSGLLSDNMTLKAFAVSNFLMFSAVVVVVMLFRKGRPDDRVSTENRL